MSDYIRPGTKFPSYYQFPEFLLRIPISQTAKLAYMVLYDRARLSQKNGWSAGGKVYVVYPIAELAATLGKAQSTIKAVLNELDENGLLIRKSGGFSKANILYVLIPAKGQFSEGMKKTASVRPEKDTNESGFSEPLTDSFSAPIKVIETNNRNQNDRTIQRTAYGRYENIYLSDEEKQRLKKDLQGTLDCLIEEMSIYCEANGKKYQNYEAALRSWDSRSESEQKTKAKTSPGFEDYSFEPGESY